MGLLGVLGLSSWPVVAKGHDGEAMAVMQWWVAAYPENLEKAVLLTTPLARGQQSPKRWIAREELRWLDLGIRSAKGRIIETDFRGHEALFTVRFTITTEEGVRDTFEVYTVRPFCTIWLIDEIRKGG